MGLIMSDFALYKILSVENWEKSDHNLALPSFDERFVHFALPDQLERIIGKYWADEPVFMVLKIDPEKLPGRLVLETNPGGTNQYYHLYEGVVPLDAVIESKIIIQSD